MKTCSLHLRYMEDARARAFEKGLKRHGFHVKHSCEDADLLVVWNRINIGDHQAKRQYERGNMVLVCENGTWGKNFEGRTWYTIARRYHNTAGMFPVGGKERWDSLNVDLMPWREYGETMVLPSRGIGSPPTAMPVDWVRHVNSERHFRVRNHPGTKDCVPLEIDLASCKKVITWGSGAAVKALMLGIEVESHMPNWIGQQDNTDSGRLEMFRRLAWAQFTIEEIEAGYPFERLLCEFS